MTLWQRAIVSFVGSALWLALAVIGWGGIGPFFADPARVGLVVVLVVVAIVAFFAGGNVSAGVREVRDNRWVVIAFAAIGLLSGIVPAWTDRIAFWVLDGDPVRWIGVALFALGCALRLWPVFVLGDRFSGRIAIQPGHTLVTTGIYASIRNPSYLGLLLSLLGWSLAFRSIVGVILTALMVPPLLARITTEEGLLHEQFGAEYEAYRSRTYRLIPHVY